MRRPTWFQDLALVLTLALVLWPAGAFAQPETKTIPPRGAVSDLGTLVPARQGARMVVTDANDSADCTAGSGSTAVVCEYDGSAWVSTKDFVVDSAASGTLELNTVTMATATADYDLPDDCDTATGKWVTVVVADANETASVTVTDTGDTIVVEGLELDANDELDSPTAANDSAGASITLICSEANTWFSTGRVGTWVDGGAAD